jgi:hypothetical protein
MALSHYRAVDYHIECALRTRMDSVECMIPVAKACISKHKSIYRLYSEHVLALSLSEQPQGTALAIAAYSECPIIGHVEQKLPMYLST